MGQAAEVLGPDDLPFLHRQHVQGDPDLPGLPDALHRWRQRDRRLVLQFHRLRHAGAAAVQVDRGPPGDGEQPRCQRAARIQRPAGAPGVQEGDLDGVRGQFAVAENPERDREHRPGIALVDGTNPVGVTGAERIGKTIFIHWTASPRRRLVG